MAGADFSRAAPAPPAHARAALLRRREPLRNQSPQREQKMSHQENGRHQPAAHKGTPSPATHLWLAEVCAVHPAVSVRVQVHHGLPSAVVALEETCQRARPTGTVEVAPGAAVGGQQMSGVRCAEASQRLPPLVLKYVIVRVLRAPHETTPWPWRSAKGPAQCAVAPARHYALLQWSPYAVRMGKRSPDKSQTTFPQCYRVSR